METPPPRFPSRSSSTAPNVPRSSTPAVSSPLVASPQPKYPVHELRASAEQALAQQESEKSALADALSRYGVARTGTYTPSSSSETLCDSNLPKESLEAAKELQQSREESQALKGRVQQLEADAKNANDRIEQLTAKESELFTNSQAQSQQYEQQLARLHNEYEALQNRIPGLEEEARAAQGRIAQLTADGQQAMESSHAQIQNQQQTIALLVSEKASLTASLDHMEELESGMFVACLGAEVPS